MEFFPKKFLGLFQVGPLTNHRQTQCFSRHLTTFAGGFLVLPEPVNWNYVFSNADFAKNKTIYLTVIVILIVYLILMIYSRYKDRKDTEKVYQDLIGLCECAYFLFVLVRSNTITG